MEGIGRENSSSVGMAQPDGNRNRGEVVVQEGEILALMTWQEERKSLMCGVYSNH
jgi:hypothetical protein